MTTIFFVSYDLFRPGQDYPSIDRALDDIGGVRVHQSAWAVASATTAAGLEKLLRPYVDANDQLLVMRLADGPYSVAGNCSDEGAEFLNRQTTRA